MAVAQKNKKKKKNKTKHCHQFDNNKQTHKEGAAYIVKREMNRKKEAAPLVWRVWRSHHCCYPVHQVVIIHWTCVDRVWRNPIFKDLQLVKDGFVPAPDVLILSSALVFGGGCHLNRLLDLMGRGLGRRRRTWAIDFALHMVALDSLGLGRRGFGPCFIFLFLRTPTLVAVGTVHCLA